MGPGSWVDVMTNGDKPEWQRLLLSQFAIEVQAS